jgi:NADH dehydrogenase FAD-containing subunit
VIKTLQSLQDRIRNASVLVEVDRGPAGVELSTDIKSVKPHKNVTLVDSRKSLINSFRKKLHDVALKALEELGVRVILGERIETCGEHDGNVVLGTEASIPCDLLVCIT